MQNYLLGLGKVTQKIKVNGKIEISQCKLCSV